ncbi:Eaa protein, partial [Escherichia coli]
MNTLTKEWLQNTITSIESARDEIPFGLDEDQNNMLTALKIALASLEAEPVAWMRDDADGREYNARNEFSGGGGGIPLYATPQVQVVPEEMYWQDAPVEGS